MTTEKIAYIAPTCHHPDHELPVASTLTPGVYLHKCDGCGEHVAFMVRPTTSGNWISGTGSYKEGDMPIPPSCNPLPGYEHLRQSPQ